MTGSPYPIIATAPVGGDGGPRKEFAPPVRLA